MASNSAAIAQKEVADPLGVPPIATLENPSVPDDPELPSAWLLPELALFSTLEVEHAEFNSCAYKSKYFKRHQASTIQRFPERVVRQYPPEFCFAFAKLVVHQWKLRLRLEWKCFLATRLHQVTVKRTVDSALNDLPITKRVKHDLMAQAALGGMRQPARAVARLPSLAHVGREVRQQFKVFSASFEFKAFLKQLPLVGSGSRVGWYAT
eukprot:2340689-Amphidinium_carterae.2